MFAMLIAVAANFLSEHYGAPVMLMALLLGMAFHFMIEVPRSKPGIEFTSRSLLRLGVGLLGARITFEQIGSLGIKPIAIVIVLMSATIAAGLLGARMAGRHWTFGMLAGGAVAVCGASAALAISAALPTRPDREQNTLFTVIAVTGLSTIAMVAYPILFAALGFSEVDIGILIGATIHDVAQVIGAGYAVSDTAGDIATFVKLFRVSLLPVVVIAVIVATRSRTTAKREISIPPFVIMFAVLIVMNSLGMIPAVVAELLVGTSQWLLVAAIASLGVKTALQELFAVGLGPISIIASVTIFMAVLGVALMSVL